MKRRWLAAVLTGDVLGAVTLLLGAPIWLVLVVTAITAYATSRVLLWRSHRGA